MTDEHFANACTALVLPALDYGTQMHEQGDHLYYTGAKVAVSNILLAQVVRRLGPPELKFSSDRNRITDALLFACLVYCETAGIKLSLERALEFRQALVRLIIQIRGDYD